MLGGGIYFAVTYRRVCTQKKGYEKIVLKGVDTMSNPDDAATKARREYMRRWRKNNPDKVRENNRRYWEKKAKEYRESLAQQPTSP